MLLRPMDAGMLLDRTINIYFKNFKIFMGISAAVLVPFYVIFFVLCFPLGGTSGFLNEFWQLIFPLWLLLFIVAYLSQGAVIVAVSRIFLEHPIGVSSSYRYTLRRIWPLLGVALLFFAIFVGMTVISIVLIAATFIAGRSHLAGGVVSAVLIGLAAITFMTYVGVKMIFMCQAVMLEDCGAFRALLRSWYLVKGNWWRVSVIMGLAYLLFLILVTIPTYILGLAMIPAALLGVVCQIVNLVLWPLPLITCTLLYYDILIRKEAFDLQMLAVKVSEEHERGADGPAVS